MMARFFKRVRPFAWLPLLAAVLALATPQGFAADAKGKISKNFYRFPYEDGAAVDATNDYVSHGSSPSGVTGPMDVHGQDADKVIVAAAAGRVTRVRDGNNDCGCDAAYGPCGNSIRIEHANGERSVYVHIKKNSAMVDTGDCVIEGQPLAVEGDVGFTCGSGREANVDICLGQVPVGAGDCGRHLHFFVLRTGSDEYMNPMFCNIAGNFVVGGNTYTGSDCNPSVCVDWTSPIINVSGFGNFDLFQANDSVVVDDVTVADSASVVLHAGHRVVMRPGVHIMPRGYFRAEIGACNDTPNAGCPAPSAIIEGPMTPAEEGAD